MELKLGLLPDHSNIVTLIFLRYSYSFFAFRHEAQSRINVQICLYLILHPPPFRVTIVYTFRRAKIKFVYTLILLWESLWRQIITGEFSYIFSDTQLSLMREDLKQLYPFHRKENWKINRRIHKQEKPPSSVSKGRLYSLHSTVQKRFSTSGELYVQRKYVLFIKNVN